MHNIEKRIPRKPKSVRAGEAGLAVIQAKGRDKRHQLGEFQGQRDLDGGHKSDASDAYKRGAYAAHTQRPLEHEEKMDEDG